MSYEAYPQIIFGTAVLELIGLFLLVPALWWMRLSINRRRAGDGGRVPIWIAGGAALSIALAMVGFALFTTLVTPMLIDSFEQMEAGKEVQAALIGNPAPELRFHSVADDRHYDLTEFGGEVLLVNFWATWCGPCRREMPDLERLQSDFRGRGLTVIHLSNEPRETLTAYLEEERPANLHVYAGSSQWPAFALPTSYVVDREGVLQKFHVGGARYDLFATMVEPYL